MFVKSFTSREYVTVVSASDYTNYKTGYLLIVRSLDSAYESIVSWNRYPTRKVAQAKADTINRIARIIEE
jgi:hypothetical protein